jgi:hypothetical protein
MRSTSGGVRFDRAIYLQQEQESRTSHERSMVVLLSLAVIMGPFEPRFAMGMGPPVCQ